MDKEALTLFQIHLARYLDWRGAVGISPRTIESQGSALQSFIAWCAERSINDPGEITPPILERYRRHLYHFRKPDGHPLSLGAQRNRLTPLKGFFGRLAKEHHIPYNPASELELPRPHKRLPRAILSKSEVAAVLNQALLVEEGIRDRAIIETLYATGIRRMELVNLKLDDIDLEQGTLMVRQGKGNKDRLIPIGERACNWIDRYLIEIRPGLVVEPDCGHLFLTSYGEALIKKRLPELVKKHLLAAGVTKPGACHLFRHTMATQMLDNGADIRFIQAMLGHADISTTQIYTQVSIAKLKEVYTRTHPAKLEQDGMQRESEQTIEEELLEMLEVEAGEDLETTE